MFAYYVQGVQTLMFLLGDIWTRNAKDFFYYLHVYPLPWANNNSVVIQWQSSVPGI